MILKNIPVRDLPMFMQVFSVSSIATFTWLRAQGAMLLVSQEKPLEKQIGVMPFFTLCMILNFLKDSPWSSSGLLQSAKSWLSKAPICFNSLRFHSKSATVCLEYLWTLILNCHLKCVYCMLIDGNVFIVMCIECASLYKCLMFV